MKTYINPPENTWQEILKRPLFDVSDLYGKVQAILTEIRQKGDQALREFTAKFDGAEIDRFEVSAEETYAADDLISDNLKAAIDIAANNIKIFHAAQKPEIRKIETVPGVTCWQKAVAIEKVGLYIPGGTAPLFSTVLMLAIPAQIAGCKEIVLCSPPNKEGKIHPAILYAAKVAGVTQIYKLGGVQAIGAMAYGTQTVPKVDKIFGPGNQFVMAAKQLVSMNDVSIDMPAGPSEVLVVADESSNPAFVASDLLSQAEHGADSQVILVADQPSTIEKIKAEVEAQVAVLPRKELAEKALSHSVLIAIDNPQQRIALINEYAPEHLIISTKNYIEISEQVINAGSVFLGELTPESAGDYASGTNHTLPTNGWARSYSGVNLDSFLKKITFQEITKEGLKKIGLAIELMAEAEQLEAHKNAVTLRLRKIE
ncbi:histidinol dehydrogenase [Maribellus sp. YY47]|uniref:histidinol dehydrogenase n=1 Tax=Maribellus sp. YY47 TaxID=2929486 RepID=UPI0020014312|nr:histidinol dehydrogenase [Maribellus sp. YY47]MCK3684740.1 histidinol dehydrogenase [Maribellus sp. YY47]